jgi:hypothetical protein
MENTTTPDWKAIYRVLADDDRREIINHLVGSTGPKTTTELAGVLGDQGDDEASRKRRLIRLYHVSLPMMEEADVLRWDRDEDIVELTTVVYQVPLGAFSPSEMPSSPTGSRQRADD